MCGFPKDNAMYYKAWWNQTPLVHIFPHWNFSGQEGKSVDVWCYGNCDAVELRVNGKSLGRKKMPRFLHLNWAVPFHPGVIEALGYRNNVVVAAHRIETTGTPAGIILTPDRRQLSADGQDITPITIAVTDSEGRLVPTARNMVRFTVTGSGTLAGVANGDPSCHEPNQANYRSAFNGLCMLLVRAGRRPGKIRITASAPGLTSASAVLHVTAS
jgi:beta-galactosidase